MTFCLICVLQWNLDITVTLGTVLPGCYTLDSKESPKWSQYITGSLHKQVTQCITARKYCPKDDRYIQVPLYLQDDNTYWIPMIFKRRICKCPTGQADNTSWRFVLSLTIVAQTLPR